MWVDKGVLTFYVIGISDLKEREMNQPVNSSFNNESLEQYKRINELLLESRNSQL